MARAHLSAVTVSITLAGCAYLMPGDGAFGLTGTLSPVAGGCELFLLNERGAELPVSRRKIQGQFRVDYTVAPYAAEYQAIVSCNSRASKVATIRYGTDVKPGQLVALGDIAL